MAIEADTEHPFGAFEPSGLPDIALADVATFQDGIIGHAQLVGLGFTRREIQRRLEAARLHRIHRGVYAVGHRALSLQGMPTSSGRVIGSCASLGHRSSTHHVRSC